MHGSREIKRFSQNKLHSLWLWKKFRKSKLKSREFPSNSPSSFWEIFLYKGWMGAGTRRKELWMKGVFNKTLSLILNFKRYRHELLQLSNQTFIHWPAKFCGRGTLHLNVESGICFVTNWELFIVLFQI